MRHLALLGGALLAPLVALGSAADIELTTPDGRSVLLKEDRTWRYADEPADAKPKPAAEAPAADKKAEGEALLSLEGRIEGNRTCRLQLRLVNNLPYEIRSIVPELAVYRQNDVPYDSLFIGFSFVKPGDSQRREVRFNGIDCKDIVRVHVGGADRCEMGELDKFTPGRGMCLARLRVVASDVLPFEKRPAAEKPDAKDAAASAKPEPSAAQSDAAAKNETPTAKSEAPAPKREAPAARNAPPARSPGAKGERTKPAQ
jgi:hypothetical protein